MKRILFIPSDHGGGKGHVTRALILAKMLQSRGNKTAIILEKKHFNEGLNAGIHTFLFDTRMERLRKYQFKRPLKPNLKLLTKLTRRPVFIHFSGLTYQVPRDGYWTAKLIALRLKKYGKIVEEFKPDVLLGDTHFLTFLLGKKYSIPVVQATRLQGYPPKPDFLWWQQNKNELLPPNAVAPFEKVLSELQITSVKKAEDLLAGDRYLIPSNKEMEPVSRGRESLHYCGALTESSSLKRRIPFFEQESDTPNIYVTIGGGAERGQLDAFFKNILDVFNQSDFRVLVSTAGKVPAKKFNGLSANVVFEDWVDGMSAILQSDLVVHHGGYATTMETVLAKKPALVIPSHSEQEGNGRRLEQLGFGKTIIPYRGELTPLEFKWPYGNYTMAAAFENYLEREEVIGAVNSVLYSDSYERLQKNYQILNRLQSQFDPDKLLDF